MTTQTEIRDRLLARREELRRRESRVNAGLRQQPDLSTADEGDASTQSERNGLLTALSRNADAELEQIDQALERLDDGRYGNCVVCGEPIEPQRLAAVPYTDRCFACAERAAPGSSMPGRA